MIQITRKVAKKFMMRVLVVDNNVELCRVLTEFFDSQPDMEAIGEAYDGEEALLKIQDLEPDVVILDITMPHLDGIGVLERLHSMQFKPRPRIIVLTAFGKDDLIAKLTEYGVDYFIVKPFNLSMLAERVRQFANESEDLTGEAPAVHSNHDYVRETSSVRPKPSEADTEQRVIRLLHDMGVPPHFKGFTYLRDAVLICGKRGFVGGGLTKEIYPALANKYNATVGGVEAAIRNAVVSAWDNGDPDFIVELCGAHFGDKVPTNSLIIAKLTEHAKAT